MGPSATMSTQFAKTYIRNTRGNKYEEDYSNGNSNTKITWKKMKTEWEKQRTKISKMKDNFIYNETSNS